MAITEIPLRGRPDMLQVALLEQDSLETRFATALTKSPIRGLLHSPTGWTDEFLDLNARADTACIREQICGHGLDHGIRVAKNALFLSDLVAPPSAREGTVLSDSSLVFAALVHDWSYGDSSLQWVNKYALGHEEKSIEYLNNMRKRERAVFPVHNGINESLSLLDRNFEAYSRAIQSTSDDPETQRKLFKTENPQTPESTLSLVLAFADAADLFRSSRLEGVRRPDNFEENPYYFLSSDVSECELAVANGNLVYAVTLNNGRSLASWQTTVKTHGFGEVFELGEHFARSTGHEFEVREIKAAA